MQDFLATCSIRLGLVERFASVRAPIPSSHQPVSSPFLWVASCPVLRAHLSGSLGSSELGSLPRFDECSPQFVIDKI